jgi:dTDP-4-dehydrorhamnose 3,5-epimerase
MDKGSFYVSSSVTHKAHTVRGLHFQSDAAAENKILSVTRGAIFDLVVSLDESKSLTQRIFSFTLAEEDGLSLFIPRGFAHGFQTLEDDTTIIYGLDSEYNFKSTRGFSPLSPAIRNLWPHAPINVKPEDLAWPLLAYEPYRVRAGFSVRHFPKKSWKGYRYRKPSVLLIY